MKPSKAARKVAAKVSKKLAKMGKHVEATHREITAASCRVEAMRDERGDYLYIELGGANVGAGEVPPVCVEAPACCVRDALRAVESAMLAEMVLRGVDL